MLPDMPFDMLVIHQSSPFLLPFKIRFCLLIMYRIEVILKTFASRSAIAVANKSQ